MITNIGENYFFDYFSGRVQRWAGKMAVGISTKAVTKLDKELDFHVSDATIDIIVPDLYQQLVVIRGIVPVQLDCEIHELGLYHDPSPSLYQSIAQFDPSTEEFTGGLQTFNTRAGSSAVLLADGDVLEYGAFPLRLDSMAAQHEFRIAGSVSGGSATLNVRFGIDAQNYYQQSFTFTGADPYQVVRAEKRVFQPVGFPDWTHIQTLQVEMVAGAGVELRLDSMRAGPKSSAQQLLAREVLTEPVRTQSGQETEIEYKVRVDFGN